MGREGCVLCVCAAGSLAGLQKSQNQWGLGLWKVSSFMKLNPKLSEAEENTPWCMNIAYVMGLSFFEVELPQMQGHKNSTKPQSYSAWGLQWIRRAEELAFSLKVKMIELISGTISRVTSKFYISYKRWRSPYAIPAMSNQRGKQAWPLASSSPHLFRSSKPSQTVRNCMSVLDAMHFLSSGTSCKHEIVHRK